MARKEIKNGTWLSVKSDLNSNLEEVYTRLDTIGEGIQGPAGEDGQDGQDATIQSINATGLPAGSNPTASLGGTPSARTISLGIPKGDKGDKGDTGNQGIQGIQGIKGDTGVKGDPGEDGIGGDGLIWSADYDALNVPNTVTPPWKDRNLPSAAQGQPAQSGRISLIYNEALPGTGDYKPKGKAMRVQLLANDVYIDGGSSRAEAFDRYPLPWSTPQQFWPDPAGSIRWYSYNLLVPTGFNFSTEGTDWLIITQLKGYHGGNPPISISINRNQLRLDGSIVNEIGSPVPDTRVDITPGVWMKVVLGVKLSTTNDGWVEFWVNDKNVIPRTVTRTMDLHEGLPDPIYLKQGIYRYLGFNQNHTLYFGPTKIGGSKAAVDNYTIPLSTVDFPAYLEEYAETVEPPTAEVNAGTLVANLNYIAEDNPTAPLIGGRTRYKTTRGARVLTLFSQKSDILNPPATVVDVTTEDSLYGKNAVQLNLTQSTLVTLAPLANSTSPIDVTNGILRFWHKPIALVGGGLDRFSIELHSAGTPSAPTANFHQLSIGNAPYDFGARLTSQTGIGRWQSYGIPINNMILAGTGADLTQIRFARLVIRSNKAGVQLQIGNIEFIPNPLDKAKAIFSFDDGYLSHADYVARKLAVYGFPAVLFPSPVTASVGISSGRISTQQVRNLHDYHGWQIGSQAWSTENFNEVLAMGVDGFTSEMSKLRNWHKAMGVTGGEHGSYFSGITPDVLEAFPVFRKHFRSMRRYDSGNNVNPPMQIGESFPFGDPMNIRCLAGDSAGFGANNGQRLIDHAQQAITNKGVAYYAWHDTLAAPGNDRTGFEALLTFLDENRDKIDVVTEDDLYSY